jgi:hypothetical protein
MDTGPGFLNRAEMEKVVKVLGEKWHNDKVSINQTFDDATEVFTVRESVWKAGGMAAFSGCLCIRCLEKRLGRQLRSKDFLLGHAFNDIRLPGTALRAARLLAGKHRS